MSDARPAIRFDGVGKMYKIFGSRRDNLLDSLGLGSLTARREGRYREFWALRGIDFELRKGERLGIIGRNGAGKSTLLKLMTGNLAPTEGSIEVRGSVQALLEIGGGLHPEFTGYENIEAALIHLGLSPRQIAGAEQEIADFTELGSFLDQPFKTYSLGMQARLSFAIATVIEPEILIIDEILGAGDAYFFGKSTARMQELIESGASVLLVSHGLDQVIRFCDETIWLDRGRIAMRGPSVEVVKAYEKFIRELEDRRLVAKNRKSRSARYDAFEREGYTDYVTVRVAAGPTPVEVAEVALRLNDAEEERVVVGGPQDADPGQAAHIVLEGDGWSGPEQAADGRFRRAVGAGASADTVFNLWFYYPDGRYEVELVYRAPEAASVAVGRSGRLDATIDLPATEEWSTVRLDLVEPGEEAAWEERAEDERPAARVSRWPGEGSLTIEKVVLADRLGEEQAVFPAGSALRLDVQLRAQRSDTYRVVPVAALYRIDGILITNVVGEPFEAALEAGETTELVLAIDELDLGDGRYVFSLGMYRELSAVGPSVVYDLIDRSYEFEVVGNGPFDNGVFRRFGAWSVRSPARSEAH